MSQPVRVSSDKASITFPSSGASSEETDVISPSSGILRETANTMSASPNAYSAASHVSTSSTALSELPDTLSPVKVMREATDIISDLDSASSERASTSVELDFISASTRKETLSFTPSLSTLSIETNILSLYASKPGSMEESSAQSTAPAESAKSSPSHEVLSLSTVELKTPSIEQSVAISPSPPQTTVVSLLSSSSVTSQSLFTSPSVMSRASSQGTLLISPSPVSTSPFQSPSKLLNNATSTVSQSSSKILSSSVILASSHISSPPAEAITRSSYEIISPSVSPSSKTPDIITPSLSTLELKSDETIIQLPASLLTPEGSLTSNSSTEVALISLSPFTVTTNSNEAISPSTTKVESLSNSAELSVEVPTFTTGSTGVVQRNHSTLFPMHLWSLHSAQLKGQWLHLQSLMHHFLLNHRKMKQ